VLRAAATVVAINGIVVCYLLSESLAGKGSTVVNGQLKLESQVKEYLRRRQGLWLLLSCP